MKLSIRGIQLNVHDHGEAEPALVFLHYWGGSGRTWDGVASRLCHRYRTVAIDQRGWGDSDGPAGGYGIVDLADDAAAAVASLGLRRYVLIGHSMGGKVAQLLASRRPRGLTGLVLVAPSPAGGVSLSEEQREALLHVYDSVESIEAALDGVLTGRPLRGEVRQRAIEDSLRGSPAAKRAWPASSMGEDVSADLARIEVPTLVVAGELDQVDPLAVLEREVVARIPGAKLHVIAGAGHLSPLDAPEALAAQIAAFVEERGRA